MFRILSPALLVALSPAVLLGQFLTISASPDPKDVRPGSVLSFTAVVPKVGSPQQDYALWCTEPKPCSYPQQKPGKVTANSLFEVTLTFGNYTIPSWMKPGTKLCFVLGVPGLYKQMPYGDEPLELRAPKPLATSCTQLAALEATAKDAAKAAATAQSSAAPRLALPGGRTATSSGANLTSVARTDIGALPDLVITYEKTPMARWIVRNIGTAKSTPTHVKFERLNVPESKFTYVKSLAPGDSAVIMVTPDLDIYLVNSFATVDPSSQIKESDETNNQWTSAASR
jgi:hypothetical protein